MRRHIKPLAVAAEAFRIAPGPGDGAAHLLEHRQQVAAGLIDIDEIDKDRMRAGANERLGLERVIGRLVAAPGAAVNEEIDRAHSARRAEQVELLVFALAVSDPLRLAEHGARPLARGKTAGDDTSRFGA